jgi:hypothetical protein
MAAAGGAASTAATGTSRAIGMAAASRWAAGADGNAGPVNLAAAGWAAGVAISVGAARPADAEWPAYAGWSGTGRSDAEWFAGRSDAGWFAGRPDAGWFARVAGGVYAAVPPGPAVRTAAGRASAVRISAVRISAVRISAVRISAVRAGADAGRADAPGRADGFEPVGSASAPNGPVSDGPTPTSSRAASATAVIADAFAGPSGLARARGRADLAGA